MSSIAENLAQIQDRIRAAAEKARRDPKDITLIAVSKTHDAAAVKEALQAGQAAFGENRVQEAARKFPDLRAAHPGMKLHLIGPLQTNKVDDAVALFDVIDTIDRMKLADALSNAIKKQGKTPRLSIEVNIGNEPQKAGVAPDPLGDFLAECRESAGLTITGLMCIPPQGMDPIPYFRRMKDLAERFLLDHLSMGMSGDFEDAVKCGATELRIGAAIFGKRQ